MTTIQDSLPALVDWLWQDSPMPQDVEAAARELLLDTLGCAIAGMAEPEVAALVREHARLEAGPLRFPGMEAGMEAGMGAAGFTLAAAAAACWHEACEGLAAAHGRPGLHAASAVLAPALLAGSTLHDVLAAIVAGYEVGGRLGSVCRIRPGMHVDGTWGSFAAAAAVSRLRGLDRARVVAALDHVACHMPFSLYWPIAQGSTARNAYAGHGAWHGAAATAAAAAKLGGPPGSIDEWARIALGATAIPAMQEPGTWLILDGYLKPYPAVRHVHYGVVAAAAWRATHPDPEAIEAVTLHIYEEALRYCGNRAPRTAIQAQFSLTYGLAHALLHGGLDPAAYAPGRMADPLLRRLEAMIALRPDPALTRSNHRGCTLEIQHAGTTWQHAVTVIAGDPGHRMTRDAVRAKFMAYATPVIGADWAGSIAGPILDGPAGARFRLDQTGTA